MLVHLALAAGFALVVHGCAASPPAKPVVTPKAPAPTAQKRESELYRQLSRMPAGQPVLEALPPQLHAKLEQQKKSLNAEQLAALLEGSDPVVATRPLLYLVAGGSDLSLLSLLFSSPAASNELVGLQGDQAKYPGLIEVSNELARRAAYRFLRERAVDVSTLVAHRPEHLEQVALAARVLDRLDLERMAVQDLVQRDQANAAAGSGGQAAAGNAAQDSVQARLQWELALSQVEARALNPELARKHLAAARRLAHGARPRALEAAEQLISAADTLKRGAPEGATSLEAQLRLARAALDLGDEQQALALLQPSAAQLGQHLAYTTTLLRAQTSASSCPKLLPTVGTERLCRQAWSELMGAREVGWLEQAWKSGQGRDRAAVEAYLGLRYLVPLMHGLNDRGQPADLAWAQRAFSSIERAAQEASASEASFAGIATLAHGLDLALQAANKNPSAPPSIEPAARTALLSRAQTLLQTQGSMPWVHAAALGSAAIVAQQERLYPLLKMLEHSHLGQLNSTLGALQLWDALADNDAERFSHLRVSFGEIAVDQDVSSFERSQWLVLWAEAEAHLLPSARSFETLKRIAENLSGPDSPLDLRLRSAINLAGMRARNGDLAGAVQSLEPIVRDTPKAAVATANEQELLIAATGYLLVLRGLTSAGSEQHTYAAQLEALLLDVARANAAPPTLQMWLMMWRSDFDARAALDRCQGKAACIKNVERKRGADYGYVAMALGARSAALLRHGVLPVGGVQIELRYQGRGAVIPEIAVSPQFLLAHIPPFLSSSLPAAPRAAAKAGLVQGKP